MPERFPDGQDVEVFTLAALTAAWNDAKLLSEREHVTPYIRNNSSAMGGKIFSSIGFPATDDYSAVRMTVDEPRDLELMKRVITDLGTVAIGKPMPITFSQMASPDQLRDRKQ